MKKNLINNRARLIWFSPAGSTERIAGWFAEFLAEGGFETITHDITGLSATNRRRVAPSDKSEYGLLIVGSPVYNFHASPIVLDFINRMPRLENGRAIIFCSYGGISPGAALDELDDALFNKGVQIIGAAAFPAAHSMMFRSASPLCADRPDEEERDLVERLIAHVVDKQRGFPTPEPRHHRLASRATRMIAGSIPPKALDKVMPRIKFKLSRCVLCGDCVKACPVEAINIDGDSIYRNDDCIGCYNCVRICTNSAVSARLENYYPVLRLLSRLRLGPPEPVIFD